jgi:hypothetical protein
MKASRKKEIKPTNSYWLWLLTSLSKEDEIKGQSLVFER